MGPPRRCPDQRRRTAGGTVSEVSDDDWVTSFQSVFLGAVRLAREVSERTRGGGRDRVRAVHERPGTLPRMAVSNGLRPGLAMVAKQLADEVVRVASG